MSHSYSCNRYHIIFSTKHRVKSIPKEHREDLWAFIGGIARQKGMKAIAVGGVADHCHLLLIVPPSMPVAKGVQVIKSFSSKWCNQKFGRGKFAWQEGYASISVSTSLVESTVKYILNQEQHHRRKTFEEEFVEFLKKNEIEYDPKFVYG